MMDVGAVCDDRFNDVTYVQFCEMLGWKGKGTQFDILPMLLNGSDGEPHYYELPERLCMEVKIRHPTIEAVTNLNLKWFGLPGKMVVRLMIMTLTLTVQVSAP